MKKAAGTRPVREKQQDGTRCEENGREAPGVRKQLREDADLRVRQPRMRPQAPGETAKDKARAREGHGP
ncbi:hypothetical protein GCM10017774_54430 [Lentzea cavernae]|uniref:Uncharacterized protein n=1 Tax=Lentzea cavernae TaxID=2020703 RepID=A0ABQ3MQT5_9PSEU|nr:hypothetical protein GCM10017774_54430 [Lentzea cavernae]